MSSQRTRADKYAAARVTLKAAADSNTELSFKKFIAEFCIKFFTTYRTAREVIEVVAITENFRIEGDRLIPPGTKDAALSFAEKSGAAQA